MFKGLIKCLEAGEKVKVMEKMEYYPLTKKKMFPFG